MEDTLVTAVLRPGEAERVVAGHPWIYQGSIARLTGEAKDGDVVQVKDSRARFLGIGFYNSRSKIHIRLLDTERAAVDAGFFERKLRAAQALRDRHLPGAHSYRVANAESDFLSGLIVDKYEDVLVLQISSLGMDQRKSQIVEALTRIYRPRAILERSDVGSRKFEGLAEASGVIAGEIDGPVLIEMNGVKLSVDLIGGHKTGCYLDQQSNYDAVGRYAKGAQVLDCFCFLGAFGLHAAKHGAARVLGIDQSADAIAAAQANAQRNGLGEQCQFETANVFDWFKAQTTVPPHEKLIPKYDLIVLDPPSFTRNRATVPDALRGYKEIHLRALKLLRPGGTLATFCCSHHVDASLFMNVILEAAFDARRVLRKVATFGQSLDHPVLPSVPETEYLKGFAFEIAR